MTSGRATLPSHPVDLRALADAIDAELRARATPGRAEHEKAYLKSPLDHHGTGVPTIRAVAKDGEGDFARFSAYADQMLEEREFFVRKAIGWVLRDTARRRPDLVYRWLLPRARRASGVTVREAVKPLSEPQRAAILGAR